MFLLEIISLSTAIPIYVGGIRESRASGECTKHAEYYATINKMTMMMIVIL